MATKGQDRPLNRGLNGPVLVRIKAEMNQICPVLISEVDFVDVPLKYHFMLSDLLQIFVNLM